MKSRSSLLAAAEYNLVSVWLWCKPCSEYLLQYESSRETTIGSRMVSGVGLVPFCREGEVLRLAYGTINSLQRFSSTKYNKVILSPRYVDVNEANRFHEFHLLEHTHPPNMIAKHQVPARY